MPDENNPNLNRLFAARIVGGYLRRNQVAPDQLPVLIATVHEALGRLVKPAVEPIGARSPAVPIRRSVTPNAVVCLDCGFRGQMLRRHLMTAHGLGVDEYRARWSLPRDHALVAPAYRERRSELAKQIGLGRGRRTSGGASGSAAPETSVAAPRRRGRPRTRGT
jgi:predicted transcriptional regulator